MDTITIIPENINTCELPQIEKKNNFSSILLSVFLLVLAAAMFILSTNVESNIGSSSEIFAGVVAVLIAFYMLVWQRKKLVDSNTGSVVSKDRLYYGSTDLNTIKNALTTKRFDVIKKLQRQADGNIQLVFFFSQNHRYIAIQVMRYEPFEYIPETHILVFRDNEAENLISQLNSK